MATSSIQWTGDDSSNRTRSTSWYVIWITILIAIGVGAGLAHFFLGYWQFWSMLVLAIVIFITLIISNKYNRKIEYSLTKEDITINGKKHPLSDFKAFSVSNLGGTWIISLVPVKKISMEYDILVPSENAERIVDVFNKLLPMEDHNDTLADKIASTLKF